MSASIKNLKELSEENRLSSAGFGARKAGKAKGRGKAFLHCLVAPGTYCVPGFSGVRLEGKAA